MSENMAGDTNREQGTPAETPKTPAPENAGAQETAAATPVADSPADQAPETASPDSNATEQIAPFAADPAAPATGPAQPYPAQTNPTQPIYTPSPTQSWQNPAQPEHPAQPAQPVWNEAGTPAETPRHVAPEPAYPAQEPTAYAAQDAEAPYGYEAQESYPATAAQPTQAYPAAPSAEGAGYQHNDSTHAEAGYPASNAYPHVLAPAVTARPRQRKKVGMGLFAGSVVAAALVGGLVAGGTTYLVGQQSPSTVASSTQQSSPIVVNNPSSVNAVTAAAAKALPSVVTISATSGSSGGTGSGIILNTNGDILTNTHVVTLDGAAAHASISVQTSDGKVYAGTVVGTDPLSDLAIVKISAPNLVPAVLGDSSTLNVGDNVVAIGAPLGLSGTVTDGIVSTLNRTIQVASSAVPSTPSDSSQGGNGGSGGGNGFQFSPPDGSSGSAQTATGTVNLNVIQTDAAINPGNSGGALVNSSGQVIGVNVAIASASSSSSSSSGQSGNIGVGFSIPINNAKRIAQELIANGKATHGQLGVSVQDATAGGSSGFTVGAQIASVTSSSPAGKGGLKAGDVITALGGQTVSDASSLTAAVRQQAGGATVKVTFTRNGKTMEADVTLGTAAAS